MYTYKENRKEEQPNGTLKVYVDFHKDGNVIASDFCFPGDDFGFNSWLKGKFLAIKTGSTIKVEIPDGTELPEPTDPVVEPPELTPEEIARNIWLEKYYKWVRIKTTVVDTGIVPLENTKITGILQDLKDTIRPQYIDHI